MKTIPSRMCISCRQMTPKTDLIRVVKTPENEIKIDLTGKANGRGAYLCKKAECLAKCKKSNALARQLETPIPKEIYDDLEKIINNIN